MAAVELEQLIRQIGGTSGCEVMPPAGQPELPSGLALPDDLAAFYALCGGVVLYPGSDYSVRIVGPGEFGSANLAVLGETGFDDRSDLWFAVAVTPDSEYISIDLSPERLGRCYDSFHEVHGIVGESRVVATCFTDLLEHLLTGGGRRWFWLEPEFQDLGDAYD